MKLLRGGGVVLFGFLMLGFLPPLWAQIKPSTANPPGQTGDGNRANPNPYLPRPGTNMNQAANTAVLGKAGCDIPPQALGYNPTLRTPNVNISPVIAPTVAAPGNGYSPGYGYPAYTTPAGGYLRGAADLTAATGQYWQDIQSARVTQEQARQAHIDTQRKQMELEMEYERNRATAPKMVARERAADLEWSRKNPFPAEISSGRTLNILYRSIMTVPDPTRGPTIPLGEQVLRGINLTTGTARGSTGLLKDGGKIDWPLPLQESNYDDPRNRLSQGMATAANAINGSGGLTRDLLKGLNTDLATLSSILDAQIQEVSPADYTVSRRCLNQIKDTIKALSDPTLVRATRGGLPGSIRAVSDLVGYMKDNGLEFAPAVATGDEPAYTTLYYSLRNYEASVVLAGRAVSTDR